MKFAGWVMANIGLRALILNILDAEWGLRLMRKGEISPKDRLKFNGSLAKTVKILHRQNEIGRLIFDNYHALLLDAIDAARKVCRPAQRDEGMALLRKLLETLEEERL